MAREPMMVVVDDPNEGFVTMPAEVAQKAGYPQLLGIKPEQVPKDPQKRAAMTALYRERKAARIAREEAAAKDLAEKNKPFLAEQARRAAASMTEAEAAPLAKVPAVKALQNIQRFTEGPAPTPAAPPPPDIDVSPVGRMDAPAMPRALPMPSEPKPMPAMAPPQAPVQEDAEVSAPRALDIPMPAPARVAAPERVAPSAAPESSQEDGFRLSPAMMSALAKPSRPEVEPAPTPAPAAMSAPTPMVPDWAQGFSPASTRMPDDEGKALLALAKSQSSAPAGARASALAPSAEGVRSMSVPQGYAPQPLSSASAQPSADDAALKELRDAQRSDGYSSGMRALGDQFRDAMNLILNRQAAPSNMAAGDGGYVAAAKARQALLAAQAKARRDERMTDATVADKGRDALKDAATLEAAKAKAEKTATDAAQAASDADPTSESSRRAQRIAKELLGERVASEVVDATPASQIGPLMLKFGVPVSNAETMASLGAQRNQLTGQQNDATNSMTAQRLALMEQEVELARARLKQQGEDADANRARLEAEAATKRQNQEDEKKTKIAERNVGGFSFNPEDPPSTDAAKKMADVSIARDRATIAINRLTDLYRKHGTELTGSVSGEMAAEWKVATDELRKIGDMGVPNGNDYKMLAMQLPNPTEGSDILRSTPRVLAHYKTVIQQLDRNVSTSAKAYKYTPAGSAPSAPSGRPPDIDLTTDVKEPPGMGATPAAKSPATAGVRTISVRGQQPGFLKKSLADGETARIQETGKVVRKVGDKLIYVKE